MRLRLLPLALLGALFLAACDDPSVNRSASLQGVITDASGAPMTGANVTLVRENATTAAATTTSGPDGAYTLSNLPAGAYNLTATTMDLGAFRTDITLAAQQAATADLTLTPLGSVVGTAVLEDTPAASEGITIRLTGTTFTATTPENGNFTIPGVPAGTYTLTAAASGYATSTTTVTVESGIGTVLPATLQLARERPYARFDISRDGARVTLDASTSSDSDGTITNYNWNLGDGTTRTGQQIEHTYTSVGNKTITLTVTDDDGNTDTTSQTTTISVPVVTPGNDITPVSAYGILPGQTIYIQVNHTGVANQLLYLELNRNLMLEVHTATETYYSVDAARFSLTPLLPGPASLAPQAVRISPICRGSCVILPATTGSSMVAITNHTAMDDNANLFAFTDMPADGNEPTNNSMATAIPLPTMDNGAIETIGDKDYYRIETEGSLVFDTTSDLSLRARIYFADGTLDNSVVLSRGDSTNVSVGEYVMVEAIGGEAAAAGKSMYFLDIR